MTESDQYIKELREKRKIIKRIKKKLIKKAKKKVKEYIKDFEDNIDKIPLDKFKECEEDVDDYIDLAG